MPFSAIDEKGEVTGVVKDITDAILKALRIEGAVKPKYIAYSSTLSSVKALQNGEIDVLFPIDSDLWLTEQNGLMPTDAVVTTPLNIVHKGKTLPKTVKTLAANKASIYDSVLGSLHYPNVKFVWVDNIEDCYKAILDGKADGTLAYGVRTSIVKGFEDEGLREHLLDSRTCSFGVKTGNIPLLKLMNRGLGLLDLNYGQSLLQNYDSHKDEFTFADYVRRHSVTVVIISLLVILLVVAVAYVFYKNSKKAEALNLELERSLHEQEAQKQLLEQARVKADAANVAKTNFLFSMSHDIRTPMNAIIGFTELMKKNLDDRPKAEEYLDKITSANEVLLSLINNVLEMARIDSGKENLSEKHIDDSVFAVSIVSLFESQMAAKGIAFNYKNQLKHKHLVFDPTKIREILVNLLSNALKYTPSGGTVNMTVSELPCDKPEHITVKCVIEDTGIGISKEFLPHIFDEFAREKSSTTSRIVGTGLGMAIVKKLVELMDGTIEVESELGKGTCFTTYIPHRIAKAEAADAAEEEQAIESCDLKTKRILLAEDNDINAEIAMVVLEDEGIAVERAEDGIVCLEMLKNAPKGYYDLILMDIQMPNMNGYQATEAIRRLEDKDKASIPIIAMTANAFDEDKQNAFKAGMNGHVAKPFEVKELLQAITKALK